MTYTDCDLILSVKAASDHENGSRQETLASVAVMLLSSWG